MIIFRTKNRMTMTIRNIIPPVTPPMRAPMFKLFSSDFPPGLSELETCFRSRTEKGIVFSEKPSEYTIFT